MDDNVVMPLVDTSQQDWASDFLTNSDDNVRLILPSTITSKALSEYIVGLSNVNGGYILVGAYSNEGYGSGFQSVNPALINDAKACIQGVDVEIQEHHPRFKQVYLIKVSKADSIAFSEGSPFIMKNGKPVLMSENVLINRLGLGVDSSLINMISDQITKQSAKVDVQSQEISRLTGELKEKAKLKYQIPSLLIGGFVGWILSTALNKLMGIG
ncbi:hypothetical protein [Photobacterium chitinilyticum]|nr:hypothetical protein [Photobacterium chitinilyticum]